jgi:hypothetical protein
MEARSLEENPALEGMRLAAYIITFRPGIFGYFPKMPGIFVVPSPVEVSLPSYAAPPGNFPCTIGDQSMSRSFPSLSAVHFLVPAISFPPASTSQWHPPPPGRALSTVFWIVLNSFSARARASRYADAIGPASTPVSLTMAAAPTGASCLPA